MENLKNTTEYGYGLNPNGTEANYDDYRAENPQTIDGRYEQGIREAEEDEAAEIRSLYPGEYEARSVHEALATARRSMQDINEALDRIEATLRSASVEGRQNSTITNENLGEKVMGATATLGGNINPTAKPQDVKDARFIGKDGIFYGSQEEANGSFDK